MSMPLGLDWPPSLRAKFVDNLWGSPKTPLGGLYKPKENSGLHLFLHFLTDWMTLSCPVGRIQ